MSERGKIIVVEGAYSTGKTTQARLLHAELCVRAVGCDMSKGPLLVREPGGTQLGERVRAILLEEGIKRCARSDLMLFCAARAQLIDETVKPAIESGRDVVMDRYWPSSLVYQGIVGGVGVPHARGACMIAGADGDMFGDLFIFLRLNTEDQERRTKARSDGHRFHRYAPGEIAGAYDDAMLDVTEEALYGGPGDCVRLVDAAGTTDDVHQRVMAVVDIWDREGRK